MAFEIHIETDNAAFTDEAARDDERDDAAAWGQEVARILRYVAEHIVDGYTEGAIHDANGNHVGHYQATS